MWMRTHVHASADVEMRRTELVDKDKRSNHRLRAARQRPPDLESAEVVGRWCDFQHGQNICWVMPNVKAGQASVFQPALFTQFQTSSLQRRRSLGKGSRRHAGIAPEFAVHVRLVEIAQRIQLAFVGRTKAPECRG